MSAEWAANLEWCLQMLQEFERYCCDYDLEAGEKVLTDFYRYRIQLPVRVMSALGLIDTKRVDNLRVPLEYLIKT